MAYEPTEWKSGDVVTSEKLNKIEGGIAAAGGSSLPSVTAADNGDVLTVVDGAWDKAAPSGGNFIIGVNEGVLDKTWQEIHNAISSGAFVTITNASEEMSTVYLVWGTEGDAQNGYAVYASALQFNSTISTDIFVATTADDYPEQQEG